MNRHSKSSTIKGSAVFGLGLISEDGIPEIKIQYSKPGEIHSAPITSSVIAADFLRKLYPVDDIDLQERTIILYLNKSNQILGYYKHTVGGIDGVIMDVRLIFATALLSASSGIIISHNHPSGRLEPSIPDMNTTKKIKEGGKILDILLLDHIIITKDGYYSFADQGTL